jgi:hypothetical protein
MNQHTNILSADLPHWRRGESYSESQTLLSVNGLRITDHAGRALVDGVSFAVPRDCRWRRG